LLKEKSKDFGLIKKLSIDTIVLNLLQIDFFRFALDGGKEIYKSELQKKLVEELKSSSENTSKLQAMFNDVVLEKNELEEVSHSMKSRLDLLDSQYEELKNCHNSITENNKILEDELHSMKNSYNEAENARRQLSEEVVSMAGVFEEAETARGTTLERLVITEKHVQNLDDSLQEMTGKYTAVNPDEVLSASSTTETTQPGLPADFLNTLDTDLDDRIDLDAGTW
jgi:chromosome segregation ATPase